MKPSSCWLASGIGFAVVLTLSIPRHGADPSRQEPNDSAAIAETPQTISRNGYSSSPVPPTLQALTAEDSSPLTALRRALNQPPGAARDAALDAWLAEMNSDNAGSFAAALESLPSDGDTAPAWQRLMAHWGGLDGSAAVGFALDDARLHDASAAAAVDAMTAWATTDLPALLGHVAQLTDAREVDKHLLPLAVVVAQHHSAEAVSFLMTELSPSQRPLWVERITHQWMDADLETAAGWFLTPQVAEAGSGVAVSLATRIVGANSPEEAWDWLASLPPGVARAEAWTAAFREWGLRDPGQTAALINHLAGTAPERVADLDAASRGLAESLLQHDAALASTWIGTIRDEHVFQMAQRTLREHLMAELPNED